MDQSDVVAWIIIGGIVVFYAFFLMYLAIDTLKCEVARLIKQIDKHMYSSSDNHVAKYQITSLQADIDRLRRDVNSDISMLEKRLSARKTRPAETRPVVTERKKEL